MINNYKIMENLDLKFRPLAEFVLDFIHRSPAYTFRSEGCEGDFVKYSYDDEFVIRRMLHTLYRVDFVSLDIYIIHKKSYTKLRLVFNDNNVFPSLRIECNIADGFHPSVEFSYIDND